MAETSEMPQELGFNRFGTKPDENPEATTSLDTAPLPEAPPKSEGILSTIGGAIKGLFGGSKPEQTTSQSETQTETPPVEPPKTV